MSDFKARQPTGSLASTGGQFAATPRTETGPELREPTPAEGILDLAERSSSPVGRAETTALDREMGSTPDTISCLV